MEKDIKQHLMQFVLRFAEHYKIEVENVELLSFKKRSKILDILKEEEEAAWEVLNNLIEARLKVERLQSDTEKKSKKPEIWDEEYTMALEVAHQAGLQLTEFCKTRVIPINGLILEN